jgi:hypothetical protein
MTINGFVVVLLSAGSREALALVSLGNLKPTPDRRPGKSAIKPFRKVVQLI